MCGRVSAGVGCTYCNRNNELTPMDRNTLNKIGFFWNMNTLTGEMLSICYSCGTDLQGVWMNVNFYSTS